MSASRSRQLGFLSCSGDFVIYLDSDDYVHPRRVEYAVSAFSGSVFCNTLVLNYYSNLVITNDKTDFYHSADSQSYMLHNPGVPVLWYLALLGGLGNGFMAPLHCWTIPTHMHSHTAWHESLSVDDDGEFMCRLIAVAGLIRIVPHYLSVYTRNRTKKTLSFSKTPTAAKSMYQSLLLKQQVLEEWLSRNQPHSAIFRRAFSFSYSSILAAYLPVYPRLCLQVVTKMITEGFYFCPPAHARHKISFYSLPIVGPLLQLSALAFKNVASHVIANNALLRSIHSKFRLLSALDSQA